jgi:cytidine deaminase
VTDEELVYRAKGARARAYAPYSNFVVGVALLADGEVFDAANVENASYGLSMCAERNAVMRAILEGARDIKVVAVCSSTSPPAAPCGMCLQTLREFAPKPEALRILLCNPQGEQVEHTLATLLPHGFKPEDLQKQRA